MNIREGIKKANTGLDAIKRAPILDYDTGLRCIRIQDISQSKSFENWGFTETSERDREKFLLKENDLLIARTGATVGVSIIIKKDMEAVYNNGSIRLKVNEKIDPVFLYYILQTKEFLQYIDNVSCVATQPNLRIEGLLRFNFSIDNINIQRRIASILSTYDELIEKNNRKITILQEQAQELYKEWFVRFRFPGHGTTKFENGLPEGWGTKALGDYANITMGQSPESCYYNTDNIGLPFHQGVGSYGEWYLQDDIYSTEGKRIAEPDSIIFSVRAPVGRLNITLHKIILGRGVASINAKDGNNCFLFWLLKTTYSREDMIGNGSIFASVTKDELFKQKLVIPDKALIKRFNSITLSIEKQMRLTYKKSNLLTRQRDLLLPRLMSGNLEVH